MKKGLFILYFFCVSVLANAQSGFGTKFNLGASLLTAATGESNVPSTNYLMPSGQVGLFYNFSFRKNNLIGTELLFVWVSGNEQQKIIGSDQYGNPTGVIATDNIKRHIGYIALPLYYGIKLKKLTINLGGQFGLTVASFGNEKGTFTNNGVVTEFENNYEKLNIRNFDFGGRIGFLFQGSNKISVEGTYYYGAKNIFNNDILTNWTCHVQQLTLGIRYSFFS